MTRRRLATNRRVLFLRVHDAAVAFGSNGRIYPSRYRDCRRPTIARTAAPIARARLTLAHVHDSADTVASAYRGHMARVRHDQPQNIRRRGASRVRDRDSGVGRHADLRGPITRATTTSYRGRRSSGRRRRPDRRARVGCRGDQARDIDHLLRPLRLFRARCERCQRSAVGRRNVIAELG